MFCRNCGAAVDPSVAQCAMCGVEPSQGSNYCPNCGQFLVPGDTECVNCHQSLVGSPKLSIKVNSNSDSKNVTVPPIPDITIHDDNVKESVIAQESKVQAPPPIPQPETKSQAQPQAATYSQSGPKFLASGKVYCRNCGLVINADAGKCPFCEAKQGSGSEYCPKCGTGTTPQDTLCSVCGQTLTRVKTSYIPSQPPARKTQTDTGSDSKSYTRPSSDQGHTTINVQNNNYYNVSSEIGDRSWLAALLLCILGCFGFGGLHRLYTKDYFIGILQFFSLGFCGIWQLIDLVMIISDSYKDGDGKKLSHN